MKIWMPVNLAESKEPNLDAYVLECKLLLYRLRSILLAHMIKTKWKIFAQKIKETDSDELKILKNVESIPLQYINNLQCYLDRDLAKCYFAVPDKLRCKGSILSLDKVVRLAEYGNDTIPPMNWIRHSVVKFYDFILFDLGLKNNGGKDK